ncbi:MAG: ParB/RepB/Spo0J family partition protein [Desulfuromonadaceae bacterium]
MTAKKKVVGNTGKGMNDGEVNELTQVPELVPVPVALDKSLEKLGPSGDEYSTGTVYQLALADIQPDLDNPRSRGLTDIDGLAASIRAVGVCLPILVRVVAGKFTIVAGERRFHAAKAAGLELIPAMIIHESPALVSLIENLQRLDLTGIQEAECLSRLQATDPEIYTSEQIGKLIGKSKNTVNDALSLVKLPGSILDKYRDNSGCNNLLLLLARREYEKELKASTGKVDKKSLEYIAGLMEYIDHLLNTNTTASQLRHQRTNDRKASTKTKVTPVPFLGSGPAGDKNSVPGIDDLPSVPGDTDGDNWPDAPDLPGIAGDSADPDGEADVDVPVCGEFNEELNTETVKKLGVVASASEIVTDVVKAAHQAIIVRVEGLPDLASKRLAFEQMMTNADRSLVSEMLKELSALFDSTAV